MRLYEIFVIFSFYLYISPSISSVILHLNGDQWTATNHNKSIITKARVPGSIYTDLRNSNVLKEEFYYRYNDINYRWVSYDNWTYERTFNVDQNLLNYEAVNLVLHGIDTISNISINNVLIGSTNNMFVRYKFGIKKHLKVGDNKITIAIQSAVNYVNVKNAEQIATNYPLPPKCVDEVQKGECHVNYIRKMQASFSWNWGPAFPTQGIWKDIEIEGYNSVIIRDVTVGTLMINKTNWIINNTIYLETVYTKQTTVHLEIALSKNILYSSNIAFNPLSDGTAHINLPISVNNTINIDPWFPNGVSNGNQTLYSYKVSITTESGNYSKNVKIGFRTIQLIEEPIDPIGSTFYFKVNGIRFFAKGCNWVPAHVFPELLTTDYLRNLLQSAKDANMNMLRVWGGGLYESDEFYQIADELGILIWQDFMFACHTYPTNEEFLSSVTTEVTQQVRRLQYHPSIAIWAGNNENEQAIAENWWSELKTRLETYKKDYVKLYINTMKPIVLREDTSRPFISSSPTKGPETEKEGWIAKNISDTRFGDVHFYTRFGSTYAIHAWNWTIYPSSKFTSEYGFISYPSFESISAATNESDWTYPISDVIKHRQHYPNGEQLIENLIANYLKLPVSGGKDRFIDIIYLSHIAQSMSIKTETEFYRRNRDIDNKTGSGYTMGALYWMLKDIWQAPSRSSLDFDGKWKMLHYFAKNMFQNLLISPFEDNNQTLKIAVVRDDYRGLVKFDLSVKVYLWSSLKISFEDKSVIETQSFSSKVVYSKPIADIIREAKCENRDQCVIEVSIKNSEFGLSANNFFLLSELKNAVGLQKPKIQITNITTNSSAQNVFNINIETNAITPFVWLDLKENSNIRGRFSDNGFFMFDTNREIQFYSLKPVSIDELKSKLTVRSLTDVLSK